MTKWKFTIMLCVFFTIGVSIVAVLLYSYKVGERETAEDLLHAFYTFDLNTVTENDKKIQKLASKEVYESHTLSSSNRQLRVYLKFQGQPTKAKLLKHDRNTMYYNIESQGFDSERTFALKYKYRWGKIVEVLEYEVFFLPQSHRDVLVDW